MCFGRILNIIKHIYFTLITNLSLFFQHVTYLLPYLKSYFIDLICFHAFNAFCNPLYIHLTCSDHCTPPRHTHQSDRPYAFMDSLSWIRVSVCLVEPQHHRQWASLCPSCWTNQQQQPPLHIMHVSVSPRWHRRRRHRGMHLRPYSVCPSVCLFLSLPDYLLYCLSIAWVGLST